MIPSLILALAATHGESGGPRIGHGALIVDTGAVAPDGCAAINVRFTATTATVTFPDPAACGTGWVLSSAGAAIVARDGTKWRLTIPIRIKNQSRTARPNVVHLVHVRDSSILLLPGAMYGQSPTPVGTSRYSSPPFVGMQYWNFSLTSYVAAGDYTGRESLALDFPVGTETAILRFAHANPSATQPFATPTGVPAVPATWTPPEDTSGVTSSGTAQNLQYHRHFIALSFAPGTSGSRIRALLAAYKATIVGGLAMDGSSLYVVHVPDTVATFAATIAVSDALRSESIVAEAWRIPYGEHVRERGRFPEDDAIATPTGVPTVPTTRWTPPSDTSLTVADPANASIRIYRSFVAIEFSPSATGAQIRTFLSSISAVVVGGIRSPNHPAYIVRIPDPGSFTALQTLMAAWEATTGIASVAAAYASDWVLRSNEESDVPEGGP